MSDWAATHSGVASIEAGLVSSSIIRIERASFVHLALYLVLRSSQITPAHIKQDMDMPGGIGFTSGTSSFFGGNVTIAV